MLTEGNKHRKLDLDKAERHVRNTTILGAPDALDRDNMVRLGLTYPGVGRQTVMHPKRNADSLANRGVVVALREG